MYVTCFILFLQREDGKFIDLQLGVNMKNTIQNFSEFIIMV